MDLKDLKSFRERLRRLEREIVSQLKSETECCGVTLAQCHIIIELGSKGVVSLVELSEILELDASTVSRNINGMVESGLVGRNVNEKDRRYITLSLTDKGRDKYEYIEELCNLHYSEVLKKVPPEKLPQVMESFDLIVEAVLEIKKAKSSEARCCTRK